MTEQEILTLNLSEISNLNHGLTMLNSNYKKIISVILNNGDATIPFIARTIGVSVPTALKWVQEMLEQGLIEKSGQIQKGEGRPAAQYRVVDGSVMVISIEILMRHLRIATIDLNGNMYNYIDYSDFKLADNPQCYTSIIDAYTRYFNALEVPIAGTVIAMTGRINIHEGRNQNFFLQQKTSITGRISEITNLPSYMINDTMAYSLYEKMFGALKTQDDAFYINLSRGLGMSVYSNGLLLSGTSGYAGELGHIQRGKVNRICICGKRNCLGSEISGYSMEQDYKGVAETLGYDANGVLYNDIIQKANENDKACKDLIRHIGVRLGEELASFVTMLNPQYIAISGTFYAAGDLLLRSIKRGMKLNTLSESYADVKIELLPWKPHYGLIGAAVKFFKHSELM